MIWNQDTQPLPSFFAQSKKVRVETTPDTFIAYLQRYSLSILEAARISALPSLLVWRASKWLPISRGHARALVAALALATGETFRGFLLTTREGMRPQALRFCL